MNIEMLNDFLIPVIVGLCLVVGYIVKHWIKSADNRIIPTVVTVLGVLLAIWMEMSITPEILLKGAVSGLASTGLHQALTQMFNLIDGEDA